MKFAILVHAGPQELARALHALLYALELDQAGHAVQIIFDGAGTTWVKTFEDPQHKYHEVYDTVKKKGIILGACEYCASAFGVSEAVKAAGVALAGQASGHPSIAELVELGYTPLII